MTEIGALQVPITNSSLSEEKGEKDARQMEQKKERAQDIPEHPYKSTAKALYLPISTLLHCL